MGKRVYHLKHATPRMKYQHMRNVMEFKADMKENQVNPPDRHIALAQIKDLMGSVDFDIWYDKVYDLRRHNQNAEYEQAIFSKLEELQQAVVAPASTPEPTPEPTTPTTTKPMKWHAIAPNTLRVYEQAAQDFQKITGVAIKQATAELALTWQKSMESRDFKVNTIRQRLSALATLSGVKVNLPKRERIEPFFLEATQIRTMMSMVQDRSERMLLVRLLTLGTQARTVTMTDNNFMAHLIGAEREHTLGTQKVTRILKRYARNAGLNAKQVNLRVWCLSGRRLIETLTPAELSSLLDARVQQDPGKIVEYVRPLHGMGRRSFAKSIAK